MLTALDSLPLGAVAVIFISDLAPNPLGYEPVAQRMVELAAQQDGFLCLASARTVGESGITVSFWRDRAAAKAWKLVAEHRQAQRLGTERWYTRWSLHICTIDESRAFTAQKAEPQ